MKDMFGNEAIILPEENEEEIWATIEDDPLYQGFSFSSFGRVRYNKTGTIRSPREDKNGYFKITRHLRNDEGILVTKDIRIHRAVCIAFWGQPEGENNITDHIDGCRVNNYYKNLRWTNRHGNRMNRQNYNNKYVWNWDDIPIVQLNKKNEVIAEYGGAGEIVKALGLSRMQLLAHLKGQRRAFQIGRFIPADEFVKQKNF